MGTVRETVKRILSKRTRVAIRQLQRYLQGLVPSILSWPLSLAAGGPDDGLCFVFGRSELSPELVIRAYHQGMYPRPNPLGGKLRFYHPAMRAVEPIDGFRVPKSVRRVLHRDLFEIRVDTDYRGTILACADREISWIKPYLIEVYLELHRMGVAHSVEAWQDGRLVGGVIGMSFGSYFVTESMFHRVSEASKVVIVHLNRMLKAGGFVLHDIQEYAPIAERFGAYEIPRAEFKKRLAHALIKPANFPPASY